MDTVKFVESLLPLLGGADNVGNVMHCFTRLRFNLKDESLIKEDEIRRLNGVMSTKKIGTTYSVVVGSEEVKPLFDEVMRHVKISDAAPAQTPAKKEKVNLFQMFIGMMGAVMSPIVPIICGCGLVEGIHVLLNVTNIVAKGTTVDLLLATLYSVGFYFLPFYVAYSASKRFQCNAILAMAIAGVLMHPNFMALADAGQQFAYLFDFIPIRLINYSCSIIPVLTCTYVLSILEKWLYKKIAKSVQIVFIPLISVVVMGILALVAVGPVMKWVTDLVANGYLWLSNTVPWLSQLIFSVTYPFQVLCGIHTSWSPIIIASIEKIGVDYIIPGICIAHVAMSGASLGVLIKTKNPKLKSIASTATLITGIGLTEPALYGIFLTFKKVMVTTSISIAIGGFFYGIFKVSALAIGLVPLGSFPVFFTNTFVYWLIISVATYILSCALAMTVGYKNGDEIGLPGYEE